MADYDNHADYMRLVKEQAQERKLVLEAELKKAFAPYIKAEMVDVIYFADMAADELAKVLTKYPQVLKPLLAACNLAARAIERDLSIRNVNTYKPRLTETQAALIAGYIKGFLPPLYRASRA